MTPAPAVVRETQGLQLVNRIRAEYLELPGLRLTLPQAALLFGSSITECERALSGLISSRFLKTMSDGTFIRMA